MADKPTFETVLGTTKEGLRKDLLAHLEYFGHSDTVHLIWKGYLAALADAEVLPPDDHRELNALLKDVGEDERRALSEGEPSDDA
jgi:hypothetical protein